MSHRQILGVVLIIVAIGCFGAAGFATFSMGLYADATGTAGYVPPVAWITAALGLLAIIAAICSFSTPRKTGIAEAADW